MKSPNNRIMRLNNSKDIVEVTSDNKIAYMLHEDGSFEEIDYTEASNLVKTTEHERYRYYREKAKVFEKKYNVELHKLSEQKLQLRDLLYAEKSRAEANDKAYQNKAKEVEDLKSQVSLLEARLQEPLLSRLWHKLTHSK